MVNAAFSPKSKKTRKVALGKQILNEESSKEILYFSPDKVSFSAIRSIKPGTWLHYKNDRGQSYGAYKKYNKVTKKKKTIYIIVLEKKVEEFLSLELLSKYIRAYYSTKIKVSIIKPYAMKGKVKYKREFKEIKRRNNYEYGNQLYIPDIFKIIKKYKTDNAYCCIGVTMNDIYSGEWAFLFGKASLKNRYGVFSFCRYRTDLENEIEEEDSFNEFIGHPEREKEDRSFLFLKRSLRVCIHEIGHMFGLKHCIYYRCIMNGSMSLYESDQRPVTLCPICLRKLKKNMKFDIEKRYRRLYEFYSEYEHLHFGREKQWVGDRLKLVKRREKWPKEAIEYLFKKGFESITQPEIEEIEASINEKK